MNPKNKFRPTVWHTHFFSVLIVIMNTSFLSSRETLAYTPPQLEIVNENLEFSGVVLYGTRKYNFFE